MRQNELCTPTSCVSLLHTTTVPSEGPHEHWPSPDGWSHVVQLSAQATEIRSKLHTTTECIFVHNFKLKIRIVTLWYLCIEVLCLCVLVCTNLALFINDGVQNNGNEENAVQHKFYDVSSLLSTKCTKKHVCINHTTQSHKLSVHIKRI